MTLRDFELFTDQNVHADLVEFLRNEGFNVIDVSESGLSGEHDLVLFRRAAAMGRVIITHDVDFGQIAFQGVEPFIGIVQMRPGHLLPDLNIDALRQLLAKELEVQTSFLVLVKRHIAGVKIRAVQLSP
ncbi:hypothetical protein BH11PLA2_BH11PLA2_17960 [soil metagenome]